MEGSSRLLPAETGIERVHNTGSGPHFKRRLARARSHNRPRYLKIKAFVLREAGQLQAAVELLHRALDAPGICAFEVVNVTDSSAASAARPGTWQPQNSTTGGSSAMDPVRAAPRAASPSPWLSCSSTTTPAVKRRKKQRRCPRNGHASRSCSSTLSCPMAHRTSPARASRRATTSPVDQQAPPWNSQHENHS